MHRTTPESSGMSMDTRFRPAWRSPVALWSFLAHLLIVLGAMVVAATTVSSPIEESVMWATGALALLPTLGMLRANMSANRDAGEVIFQWGFHHLLLGALAIIESVVFVPAYIVLDDAGAPDGLGYLPGGAVLGLVAVGFIGGIALLMAGSTVGFISAYRGDVPMWMLLLGMPMVFISAILMAVGAVLGVDTGDSRRLVLLVKALLGHGEIVSGSWLLVARLSAVALVISVVLVILTGVRARKARDARAERRPEDGAGHDSWR